MQGPKTTLAECTFDEGMVAAVNRGAEIMREAICRYPKRRRPRDMSTSSDPPSAFMDVCSFFCWPLLSAFTALFSLFLLFAALYCPYTALYCFLLPLTALYCALLPCTALYCLLLAFTIGFYSSFLPFSAFCCPLLPLYCPLRFFTAPDCPLLRFIALYCPLLPFTAFYCPVLPFSAVYCPFLPCTALYHPLMPFTAFYCPLLPFSALCCPFTARAFSLNPRPTLRQPDLSLDKSSSIAYGLNSNLNPKREKGINSNLNPSPVARLVAAAWFRGINSNLSHLGAMSTPRPGGE